MDTAEVEAAMLQGLAKAPSEIIRVEKLSTRHGSIRPAFLENVRVNRQLKRTGGGLTNKCKKTLAGTWEFAFIAGSEDQPMFARGQSLQEVAALVKLATCTSRLVKVCIKFT